MVKGSSTVKFTADKDPFAAVKPGTDESDEYSGPDKTRTPLMLTKASGSKLVPVTETGVLSPPLVGDKVTARVPNTAKLNKAERPACVTFSARAPVVASEGTVTVPDSTPDPLVARVFVALESQLDPEVLQKAAVKSEDTKSLGQFAPVTVKTSVGRPYPVTPER